MIGALFRFIGNTILGPMLDITDKYFRAQTDQAKIRGDIEMTRERVRSEIATTAIEYEAEESVSTIEAESYQINTRPTLMLIGQACLWAIAVFYYGALAWASVFQSTGLVVAQLPGLWELITLLILAGLAGPYVLNVLKQKLFK